MTLIIVGVDAMLETRGTKKDLKKQIDGLLGTGPKDKIVLCIFTEDEYKKWEPHINSLYKELT